MNLIVHSSDSVTVSIPRSARHRRNRDPYSHLTHMTQVICYSASQSTKKDEQEARHFFVDAEDVRYSVTATARFKKLCFSHLGT